MSVLSVTWADVVPWIAIARRDRVAITPTRDTRWFMDEQKRGVCALMNAGLRLRIKAVYVLPEFRGQGVGTAMTEELIRIADDEGRGVEVFAYNPAFYEARGFARGNARPNGAVFLSRPEKCS